MIDIQLGYYKFYDANKKWKFKQVDIFVAVNIHIFVCDNFIIKLLISLLKHLKWKSLR